MLNAARTRFGELIQAFVLVRLNHSSASNIRIQTYRAESERHQQSDGIDRRPQRLTTYEKSEPKTIAKFQSDGWQI